jgi:hypothetical protein
VPQGKAAGVWLLGNARLRGDAHRDPRAATCRAIQYT